MCLLCDLDTSFDDRVVLTAQKRRPDRRTPKFLACCGLLWGCGCCGSPRGSARTAVRRCDDLFPCFPGRWPGKLVFGGALGRGAGLKPGHYTFGRGPKKSSGRLAPLPRFEDRRYVSSPSAGLRRLNLVIAAS